MSNKTWIIASLILGTMISALEYTVISAVSPMIVLDLGEAHLFAWASSGYMITATIITLIAGKLCDRIGRKKTFLIGLFILALGSIACGLVTNMKLFIISRAVQGIGGGIIIPVSSTIVGDLYEGTKRAKIQGVFAAIWGITAILGPQFGMFIASHLDWRWLFFINVPIIGAICLFIILGLKEQLTPNLPRIDYKGIIGFIILMSCFLITIEQKGWLLALCLGVTVILLYVFVRIEKQAEDPVLSLTWLKNKNLKILYLLAFILGLNLFVAITFLPFLAVMGLGNDLNESANILIPLALGAVFSIFISSRLFQYFYCKWIAFIGFGFMFIGNGWLGILGNHSPYWHVVVASVFIGFGTGIIMPLVSAAVQQGVNWSEKGMLTAYISFFRSIGGALGAIVAALIFNWCLQDQLVSFQSIEEMFELLSAQPLNEETGKLRSVFLSAMHPVFWFTGISGGLALMATFFLSKFKLIKEGKKLSYVHED